MDESPTVDWSALDKLSSKEWPLEVLRMRRLFVDRVIASQEAASAARAVVERDKEALQAFDRMLRPRMEHRRRWLLRFFGARITTDDGQITIKDVKKVLDHDSHRDKEVLAELKRRHVRKAIRIEEKPDYEALKQMSPSFIHSLAHLGVSFGQMFYMSIKSTGEKDATNIVKRRRAGR